MIRIFPGDADDFSTLGLGVLLPTECSIEWEAGGLYELSLTHPIDDAGRWLLLDYGRIIKAPGPVREAPSVEAEAVTETVTREIYKVSTSGGKLRLRAKASTSSKVLGSYKPGTEVIRLSVSGDWARVIIRKGGATGWMHTGYLTYVRTETETIVGDKPGGVVEVKQVGDQLFRIHTVERDAVNRIITVQALHISYDLRANSVKGTYSPEKVAANTVVAYIMSHSLAPHLFEAHCYVTTPVTGEYGGKSLIECLLDPENGVVAQTKARIVRDNYDIYLLPDETRDMGVQLRYGKNLLGVSMKVDAADVVTRIEPVGKTKDGKPVYLDGDGYIDSPHVGDYPAIYARRMDYPVQIGKDGITTTAAARAKLIELAEADFTAGVDAPAVTLDVDFLHLGDTREYAAYKDLQAVHPYDTVSVEHPAMGISARLRLTKCTWDVLAGRYAKTVFGEIQAIKPTTYGYDIARGSVVGTKIAPDAVDTYHFRDLSVVYGKFDVAAVEQLMAESIAALQARIGTIIADTVTTDELYVALANVVVLMAEQITAETISTDALYAELARIVTLRVQEITAETTTTDTLYAALANVIVLRAEQAQIATAEVDDLRAALAEIVKLDAKLADIDYAKIKDLIAEEAIFSNGTAGQLYINRLAVTQANLLNATINRLVMPGGDGKYYAIVVGSDGVLHTEEVTVTAGEIAAGELGDGRQISATTINAESINGQTVNAQSATINTILTDALTAEQITAGEALIASATIPTLYATSVEAIGNSLTFSANERITMIAEAAAGAQAVAENAASLILTPEQIKAEVFASTEYGSLSTTVTQTATGLSSVQTKQTEIDGRVQTIEESVIIDGSTITIGKSDVPVQNIINETGFEIKEVGGAVLAYAREGKMGAQRLLLEDALIIGGAALKDMQDGHVLLLKYGG